MAAGGGAGGGMAAWAGALGGALAEVQKLREEVEQGVDEALGIRGKERAGPAPGGERGGLKEAAPVGGERGKAEQLGGDGGGGMDTDGIGGGAGGAGDGGPASEQPTWEQLMKLQGRNEELMQALAAAGAGDTAAIVSEANSRVSKSEERATRLSRELKTLKRQLGGREASAELLREKDRMIEQLMEEGKALAGRQGDLEGVIKKLRVQLRKATAEGGRSSKKGGPGGVAMPGGSSNLGGAEVVPPAAQRRIDELKAKTYSLNERLLSADEKVGELRATVVELEQEKENLVSSLRGDAREALERLEDADEQRANLSEQIQQAAAPYVAQVEALQSALREERASREVRAKREASERVRLELELRKAIEEASERERLVQSLREKQRALEAEGKYLQDALEAQRRKGRVSAAQSSEVGLLAPKQPGAFPSGRGMGAVEVTDRSELDLRKWKLEEKLLRGELEDALTLPRQLRAEVERLDQARQDDARRAEDAELRHRRELEGLRAELRHVQAEYEGALETLGEQEERLDDLRAQTQALHGLYCEHVDQKYQN